jgi:hypothetical protein
MAEGEASFPAHLLPFSLVTLGSFEGLFHRSNVQTLFLGSENHSLGTGVCEIGVSESWGLPTPLCAPPSESIGVRLGHQF